MKVLLDSNAYSQLMRGRKQVSRILRGAEEVLLSAVVLGELLYGFRHGSRYERNARGMRAFLDNPYVSLVPVGETTSRPLLEDRGVAPRKGPSHPHKRCLDRRPRHGDGGRSGVGRPPLRACGRDRVGSAEGPARAKPATVMTY